MNRKETSCSLMIVFKSFAELCPWAVTFTSASYWPFHWWNKVSEGLELGIFFSQGYLRSGKTPIDSVLVKYFLLREDLVKNRVLWAYFRIAIFSLILWKAWGFFPSSLHCENLIVLLKVKYKSTKVSLIPDPLGVFNSQPYPNWASSNL